MGIMKKIDLLHFSRPSLCECCVFIRFAEADFQFARDFFCILLHSTAFLPFGHKKIMNDRKTKWNQEVNWSKQCRVSSKLTKKHGILDVVGLVLCRRVDVRSLKHNTQLSTLTWKFHVQFFIYMQSKYTSRPINRS